MKFPFLSLLMLGIIDAHDRVVDPVIGLSFFETIIYLIFAILWKVNSNHHPHIKVLLHKVLFGVLISEFILSLINSIVYTVMVSFPGNFALTVITTIIALLMNGAILFLSSFLATGVSIVFDTISPHRIALVSISSLLFAIALALIETLQRIEITDALYIIILVFFIISYILYFIILVYSAKVAIRALTLHMRIIAERGINPNSSPTFKKMKMLEFTRNFAVVTIFFIVLFYLLFFVNVLRFWIVYMIKVVFMVLIVAVICYRCRIRRAMAATYGDDDDVYAVNDDDEQDPENQRHARPTEIEQNLAIEHSEPHRTHKRRRHIDQNSEDEDDCPPEENMVNQTEQNNQNIDENVNNNSSNINDSSCDNIINNEFDSDVENNNHDILSDVRSNHFSESDNTVEQYHSDAENQSEASIVNDDNSSNGNNQPEGREWTPGTVLPPIPQIQTFSTRIYPSTP